MSTIYTAGTVDPEALALLIKERDALKADAERLRFITTKDDYRIEKYAGRWCDWETVSIDDIDAAMKGTS